MGMYDSFYIDRKAFKSKDFTLEDEWQSKSLDCHLDEYFIDSFGNVTKKEGAWSVVDGVAVEEKLNFKASIYLYYERSSKKTLFYTIEVADSKLINFKQTEKIQYFE